MTDKKDVRLFIRVNSELVEKLNLAADLVSEGNMSMLAREAFREKLDKLARKHPELREEAELQPAA